MAMIEDDEIIQVFIEESHDHMDGIESDLLDIEKDGENVNVDLVNKVFRAIHSVKGGAGFLGLDNIKELSHEMENLLNLIRNKELVPSSALINTLLNATDKLNELINNFAESNEIDISEEIVTLKGATTSSLPEEDKESVENLEEVKLADGKVIFELKSFDLDQAQKVGRILYLAEFDLIRDIERKGKTPLDVIKEIQQAGIFVEGKIDIDAIGTLEEQSNSMRVPFFVLFATVLEQDLVGKLINLDDSKIFYFNKKREIFPVLETTTEVFPENEIVETNPKSELQPDENIQHEAELTKKENNQNGSIVPESNSEPETKEKKQSTTKDKLQSKKGKEPSVNFSSESLRVNVKDLDRLMTLAGELVLTRNQLVQTHLKKDEGGIENAIQGVDLITSELQEAIMATRMQPIGNVFNKFQRVVRDLANKLGKKIELIVEGEGVEMDKTIIEAIGDPLTHLIRNAVDHGIEDPETRVSIGKSANAVVRLSAYHEAGQVNIKIEDDGAGINPIKIKEKALEKGFVSKAELDEMGDNEIIKLIFKPGFSTAKEVSDVSGRGVGMDVVFNNLSKLSGTIDVESKVNVGTTLSIKLPLTLAIIPSLIVKVEDDRFAIPQVNLVELVRIPFAQAESRIETIDDAIVMRLRGELLPLIHLSDTLSIKPDEQANSENMPGTLNNTIKKSQVALKTIVSEAKALNYDAFNIVVVNSGNFNYGIIVNELLDSEEIVVKPLGIHLRHIETFAGATILGDGCAALILDIIGISKVMKLKPVKEEFVTDQQLEDLLRQKDTQSMIVVHNGTGEQFAIPLGLISRIEKIHKNDLVETSGRLALKYRGSNLVVLSIEDVANVKPRVDVDYPYVVIFQFGGREVGIIVSYILDVIDSALNIDEDTFRQPGIVGSAIIMDKITLMLDLYSIATLAMPEKIIDREELQKSRSQVKQNTILIVEDSKFFLNQIKGFTEDAGYNVLTALDGLEALDMLNNVNDEVDLVLTDIEMPNMDGVQFTREVRSHDRYKDMPILALTSVAGAEAERIAFEAGIDEYLIKLDREKVLSNIENYLENGRAN